MARAMPSWACTATRWTSPLERAALVATTPRVVLPGGTGSGRTSPSGPGSARRSRMAALAPPGTRAPASTVPSSSRTSPPALTAARAPTVTGPASTTAQPRPPLVMKSGPAVLPTVAPMPAPTLPSCPSAVTAARQAASPSAGPGLPVADGQVEQHGRGHDRDRPAEAPVAQPAPLAPGDHALGGGQPERAAPGQQHRRDALDVGLRLEQVGLAGAGPAAAHAGRGHVPGRRHHHRAAGQADRVGPVADGQVLDAQGHRTQDPWTRRTLVRRRLRAAALAGTSTSSAKAAISASRTSCPSRKAQWPVSSRISRRDPGILSAMYRAAAGGVSRSLSPTTIRAGTPTASSDSDRSKSTRLGNTLAQTSTSVPDRVVSMNPTWLGDGFDPKPNSRVPR